MITHGSMSKHLVCRTIPICKHIVIIALSTMSANPKLLRKLLTNFVFALFFTSFPCKVSGNLEKGHCTLEPSQIPSQCIPGTSFKVHYSELIVNHAIIGPVLKTLNARDHNECKDACFMNVPDECYMFNYYSQDKKCELLYKDRLLDYKVVKRNGSAFKTRKCKTNPCKNGGQCYALGEASREACICKPGFDGNVCQIQQNPTTPKISTGATETTAAAETTSVPATGAATTTTTTTSEALETTAEITTLGTTTSASTTTAAPTPATNIWVKVSTSAVCFGTKDDSYGSFTVTRNGRIKTFKLIYVSGIGLKGETIGGYGKWGSGVGAALPIPRIETHITDASNKRIAPPIGYPIIDDSWGRLGYDVPGYNYNSGELLFPEISPAKDVKIGDQFRIWYGADLQNQWEGDNSGQTCADVHALYSEML